MLCEEIVETSKDEEMEDGSKNTVRYVNNGKACLIYGSVCHSSSCLNI